MKSSPFSSLITKMNGGNYEMWAMQVKRTLIAHDKEHLILEPEPIQKVGKYGTWFKDNSLVMVWIVGTLSQDIANEVLHKESAKDMWDSLAATYSQARNETRIMQLHHDIHQMRQDDRPLHTYYSSLKSMFERLNSYFPTCKCEQQKAYRDMLMVGVFLSGLDSVYESANNQMLTSPSIPPIDEAYSRLSRIPIPAATVPDTTSAMLATRGRVDPRFGAVYQRRTRPVAPAPCAPVPSPSMPKSREVPALLFITYPLLFIPYPLLFITYRALFITVHTRQSAEASPDATVHCSTVHCSRPTIVLQPHPPPSPLPTLEPPSGSACASARRLLLRLAPPASPPASARCLYLSVWLRRFYPVPPEVPAILPSAA
ncbi:hypothetical protein EJ110_NYTH37084 [Nymphaea thermarum]|nr:hypothetical protein EJ110_NYTH37084 [Nymphaea thermarum]